MGTGRRLASRLLARLPLPHPEGLSVTGPPAARERLRQSLVQRRTKPQARLDALLGTARTKWLKAPGRPPRYPGVSRA